VCIDKNNFSYHASSKAMECLFVIQSVCLFPNSSKPAVLTELKFLGNIDEQNILGSDQQFAEEEEKTC